MKVNFNSKNSKDVDESKILTGNYEAMIKGRKKMLPKIEESIQDVLKDYDGCSVAVIVMKEDENGYPSGQHVVMAGVSRMETQIAMGKALSMMADKTMETLMESADGDPKALINIARALANLIEEQEEK